MKRATYTNKADNSKDIFVLCPLLQPSVGTHIALVFSSHEHKVLMASFCDHPMSGVHCLSCVIHNFFKHLLLLNHWANLDETWQGCSLGQALPSCSRD